MSVSSVFPAPEKEFLSLWDWFRSPSKSIRKVLLIDGGVSTHLESIISPKKFSHRELWSSSLLLTKDGRDRIIEGHRDWLESGADILTTVTYQCHYGLFRESTSTEPKSSVETNDSVLEILPEDKIKVMMVDGVKLAKMAIDGNTNRPILSTSSAPSRTVGPFVVASTGPYGAAMADGSEYTGIYPAHVTRQALVNFHTRKARTLLMEGKPDGLAIETIPNIEEVGVVCEVLRDLQQHREKIEPESSPIACWISLACRNGSELNDGTSLQEALQIVQSYDPTGRWIAGVGINCFDSVHLLSLVKILAKASLMQNCSRRGIILYPNSGEGWDAVHEKWREGSGASDDKFADRLMEAMQLIQDVCETKAGTEEGEARVPKIIIGGCCRTSPATIAKLRKRVDESSIMND